MPSLFVSFPIMTLFSYQVSLRIVFEQAIVLLFLIPSFIRTFAMYSASLGLSVLIFMRIALIAFLPLLYKFPEVFAVYDVQFSALSFFLYDKERNFVFFFRKFAYLFVQIPYCRVLPQLAFDKKDRIQRVAPRYS